MSSQVAQAASRQARGESALAQDFESIVESGYVIVGSPDEVADQLRNVALELNVGHLMLLLQFGNMGRELTFANSELFAKRVLPQLADLFDDRFEDLWWPRPVPREERATPRALAR